MEAAAASTRWGPLAFVRSGAQGSMNRHSQQLALVLGESPQVVLADAPGHWSDFGSSSNGGISEPRLRRAERSFLDRVRRIGRAAHFSNHHFARFGPGLHRPYVVTVHDLIRHRDARGGTPYIHSPSRSERRLLARDRRGIEAAGGLIAVSGHTAAELESLFDIPGNRIAVVYQGIDHEHFRPRPGPRPLLDRYLLFVGSEHPRKNLAALLEAFAQLKTEPRFHHLRLVKVGLAGGPEARYRERTLADISRVGLGRDVLFTGRVGGEELARWYSHAECLALPSKAEGFGLPPIEAMACGCPVVVSDAGALPEIAGPASFVVRGTGALALASTLRTVLDRPELRARMRARGLNHAALFNWSRTAAETQAAYERFLGEEGIG